MVSGRYLPPLYYLRNVLDSLKVCYKVIYAESQVGGKFFVDKTTYNLYLKDFNRYPEIFVGLENVEVNQSLKEEHILFFVKQ